MKKHIICLALAVAMCLSLVIPAAPVQAEDAKLVHGFRLVREEEVPDISSVAYIYEHEKTGAELIWLKNEDPFKVFAACFKTKPSNDSGPAHIVEHSLLGGSRKYKSADIFTDIDAMSTNAFMNAMTYPDKTIFPIASRDPQDFYNLTDVYLDSVFFPIIKDEKRIFDREGWHYEITDKEQPITISGVVYNEMRGAMSNPLRLFISECAKSIFPDTTYAYNSGGSPEAIPELSYEEFLEFYNTFYHPSNMLLYFYGDVDMDFYLKHIDEEYLSHFDKQELNITFEKQEPFKEPRENTSYYDLDEEEDPANKAYMGINIYSGEGGNVLDYYMLAVISDVLVDANSAPIKQALFEAGIGEDNGSLYFAYNQNAFGVAVLNADENRKDEFVKIVEDGLKDAAEGGLDHEKLLASINSYELSMREASSNDGLKGLDYMDLILDSKYYGGDPLAYLQISDIFEQLRAKIEEGAYEQFIKDRLLDNPFTAVTILLPKHGLAEEQAAAMADKLAKYKESLSDEQLDALIAENTKNESENAEEEVSLPHLTVDQIDPHLNDIDYTSEELDGTKVLFSAQPTSGICYYDLEFDLSVLKPEELPYASLMTYLLGTLDTDAYDYGTIETMMGLHTGGISFGVSNSEHTKTHEQDARLTVAGKAKPEELTTLFELIDEISRRTHYDDFDWIGQQISQLRSNMERQCVTSGQNIALKRVRSYFSPMFKYREMLSGLDYLRFIQKLEKAYTEDARSVGDKMAEVAAKVFNKNNMVIGIAADEADKQACMDALKDYLGKLPADKQERGHFDMKVEQLNEGVQVTSEVNYVVQGGDLKSATDKPDGAVRLLSNILDNMYLYPELRAKAGAYGAYSLVDNYGNFVVYSYRDPNIGNTLDVYKGIPDFLENLDIPQELLEQLIIGYFKAYPMTPDAVASTICYREINGQSNEDFVQEAEEVMATDLEKLKGFAPIFREVLDKNYICVVGSKEQIAAEKDRFMNLFPVVEVDKAE